MSPADFIERQRELIVRLLAAEGGRVEAESQAEAQRQKAWDAAQVRAAADREWAGKLRARADDPESAASALTSLPAPSVVPDKPGEPAPAEYVRAIQRTEQTLSRLEMAHFALQQLRADRERARSAGLVFLTAVGCVVIVVLGAIWARANEVAKEREARAQATVQAQAISQALSREVPSLALQGVTRNGEWTPVMREFDSVPMALVPAGCFMMGSEDGDGDERPQHKVCYKAPFWIDVTEVTNEQFDRLGGVAGRSGNWTGPQRPRESIAWAEANAFCQRRGARLPTEAEWEYAARGPDGLVFPWGNTFVADNVVCSNSQTRAVGSRPGGASWVGAVDMSGNVWEWVADWYDAGYYDSLAGLAINPSGPTSGAYRVVRGGSWGGGAGHQRAARRYEVDVGHRGSGLGFRCALSY